LNAALQALDPQAPAHISDADPIVDLANSNRKERDRIADLTQQLINGYDKRLSDVLAIEAARNKPVHEHNDGPH
jgi:hypothetical protein